MLPRFRHEKYYKFQFKCKLKLDDFFMSRLGATGAILIFERVSLLLEPCFQQAPHIDVHLDL